MTHISCENHYAWNIEQRKDQNVDCLKPSAVPTNLLISVIAIREKCSTYIHCRSNKIDKGNYVKFSRVLKFPQK